MNENILPRTKLWARTMHGHGDEVITAHATSTAEISPRPARRREQREEAERALYVLEGQAQLDGADLPEKHLVVLDPGTRHLLRAKTPLKAMLFGGEPLDGRRHMWWNFVSSSKERIEQAKVDWDAGRFGLIPGDSDERIPLPQ